MTQPRHLSEPSSLEFSDHEVERYSRHILLPQIGATGQARLRDARVFVVGAGGLGSPSLLYLAAAGVGHITVIDDDSVEVSNLQRQIAHDSRSLGLTKVVSAGAHMKSINPLIQVTEIEERLSVSNISKLIEGHDVVLDGSDNFATRFLVNDACFFAGIPLISAAVYRFEGQLSVFDWREDSPCYRCLFPSPPSAGTVPSCAEAGVLGAVVGTLGTMQATEAIKLLTGAGQLLRGRLLRYDALRMETTVLGFARNPKCKLCGSSPSITTLQQESDPSCET